MKDCSRLKRMWRPTAEDLHRSPGPAGGPGPVRQARLLPESCTVCPLVPALSPPAGMSAAQQPAGAAPPLQLQRGIQVRLLSCQNWVWSDVIWRATETWACFVRAGTLWSCQSPRPNCRPTTRSVSPHCGSLNRSWCCTDDPGLPCQQTNEDPTACAFNKIWVALDALNCVMFKYNCWAGNN